MKQKTGLTLAAVYLLAVFAKPISAQIEPSPYEAKRLGWSVSVFGDYAIASAPFLIEEGVRLYERGASGEWSYVEEIPRSEGGFHGYAVAASDDWLIFSDPTSGRFGHYAGGIYAWQRLGGRWQHYQGVFETSVADVGTRIGMSVAHRDNLVAAGGMNLVVDRRRQSFVVLFEWVSGWDEAAILIPESRAVDDEFGRTVALADSETLFVGAPTGSASGVQYAGDVYEYRKRDGAWALHQVLENPDSEPFSRFGASITSQGDLLFVGAPGSNQDGENRGSVHVFQRQGDQFQWLQTVVSEFEGSDPQFGHALAVAGDFLVVGAPGVDLPGRQDAGSISIYEISATGHLKRVVGGQPAEVAAWLGLSAGGGGLDEFGEGADVMSSDLAGYTLSSDGTTVVLGLPHADTPTSEDSGGLVFFDLSAISTSSGRSEDLPVVTAITSIFPNPVRRAATVEYTLAAPGPVTTSVYNVLGQQVRSISRGVRRQGSWEEELDFRLLPSGVYFVALETGDGARVVRSVTVR